ncbi:uncharacterized protein LOC144661173 [Oculina patagonica]
MHFRSFPMEWGYSVKKGEQAFRKWFGRINEIRSLVKGVPLLALSATATIATRKKIMQSLEMEQAVVFNQSPNHKNIYYAVQTITGGANKTFASCIEIMRQEGTAIDRIIIYCQTIKVVSHLYGIFLSELGSFMYAKQGDVKSSMVEMYHSRVDDLNQETILNDFAKPNGNIRVLISTIAFGMGINCQGVKQNCPYRPSRNIEAYYQESGRAGRYCQEQCTAVILYSNAMLTFCDEAIQAYVHNDTRSDGHKYVDVWEPCIAVDILVAIHQIFGDTDFVDNDYPSEEEEDVNLLSFNLSGSEQDDDMFRNIPDEFFILAESSDSESDV